MMIYQWYVTAVAIVACLCVAALALVYDRGRRELRALRRLLSGLPRCGMVCDGGSENRTCSCRSPANCQPDLRRFEALRRAHERESAAFARSSKRADERPSDQNARPPDEALPRLIERTAPVVHVRLDAGARRTLIAPRRFS
jgi:hypothetical protein